jgi:predicted O-methyltransferase YrrM
MFNEEWYTDNQLNDLCGLFPRVTNLQGSVIEVGCWEGRSTYRLAVACYPETLICNDTWLGNVQESLVTGHEHVTEQIIKTRDVYSIFINNMNSLTQGNYSVVKKDCLEWLSSYTDPIKFIHIDASHEYESVVKTIQLALPHLVSGGIICGDDFLSAHAGRTDLHGGVERAVREVLPGFQTMYNLWYWVKP